MLLIKSVHFDDPVDRAAATAALFSDIRDPKIIADFADSAEKCLQAIDACMSSILKDEGERTLWACVMRTCIRKLGEIREHLPFLGGRFSEWRWFFVHGAMGYLRVTIENGERISTY